MTQYVDTLDLALAGVRTQTVHLPGEPTHGHLFIPGAPIPQGSSRAFMAGGRPVITGANAKTRPWRADIHAAVRAAVGDRIPIPDGPVALGCSFIMPRRKAEPKRVTSPHTRKPDLDKLVRAVLDALTGLLFTDDSQVVMFTHLGKRTARIGEPPGLHLTWTGQTTTERTPT